MGIHIDVDIDVYRPAQPAAEAKAKPAKAKAAPKLVETPTAEPKQAAVVEEPEANPAVQQTYHSARIADKNKQHYGEDID